MISFVDCPWPAVNAEPASILWMRCGLNQGIEWGVVDLAIGIEGRAV